jgi:hypothetical protein
LANDFLPDRPFRRAGAGIGPEPVVFQVTPDFVARIRAELNDTLQLVRAAELLPWPNLTKTTLAELRFTSIAGWLPEDEATALRQAFDAELTRVYDAEDRRADGAAT